MINKTNALTLLFYFACLFFACQKDNQEKENSPKHQVGADDVIYQIFLRSFADSDGDGIGDINGMINQLDYLEELGADGVWLLPIHPSPSYHKYDVKDYYEIDSIYGSLEDFKRLLDSMHQRDMKLIIDMVVNHCSEEHPWFESAISSPNSPYRDYFVWAAADEMDSVQEQHNWHIRPAAAIPNDTTGEHYYGFFWKGMPDLNFDNPEVRESYKDIARFWTDTIGVDGMRLDAALHIYPFYVNERAENLRKTLSWWEEYKAACPNTYLVGEAWEGDSITAQFVAPGRFDAVFNFDLGGKIIQAVSQDSFTANDFVDNYQNIYNKYPKDFQDAIFLTNHDQNRVASLIDSLEAKLASAILLSLPANVYLYYGEELGMKGLKPDEQIREPFIWNHSEPPAHQTSWEALNYNSETKGVAEQRRDVSSFFNHYKKWINLRKRIGLKDRYTQTSFEMKALGEILIVEYYLDSGNLVSIFHNLSAKRQSFSMDGNEINLDPKSSKVMGLDNF